MAREATNPMQKIVTSSISISVFLFDGCDSQEYHEVHSRCDDYQRGANYSCEIQKKLVLAHGDELTYNVPPNPKY